MKLYLESYVIVLLFLLPLSLLLLLPIIMIKFHARQRIELIEQQSIIKP